MNHPNVLTIHDAEVHDGAPYLVSELLEGKTLREEMSGGALPVRKATEYALLIAHGLAAAYGKDVTHRDLKPENIFVTKDGRAKILDFGLAKLKAPVPADVRRLHSESGSVFYSTLWDGVRNDPRFLPIIAKLGYAKEYQVARETRARLSKMELRK